MYDVPEIEPTPEGNEMEPVYELKTDDKGNQNLVKTGETNIREKMQQYKDECDVKQILARAVVDPNALNQRQGFYADVTEMPKSLGEAQQMINDIKTEFNKLPPEERAKFNFSAEEYVAQYGTEEWLKKVTKLKEPVNEQPVNETAGEKGVVANES